MSRGKVVYPNPTLALYADIGKVVYPITLILYADIGKVVYPNPITLPYMQILERSCTQHSLLWV